MPPILVLGGDEYILESTSAQKIHRWDNCHEMTGEDSLLTTKLFNVASEYIWCNLQGSPQQILSYYFMDYSKNILSFYDCTTVVVTIEMHADPLQYYFDFDEYDLKCLGAVYICSLRITLKSLTSSMILVNPCVQPTHALLLLSCHPRRWVTDAIIQYNLHNSDNIHQSLQAPDHWLNPHAQPDYHYHVNGHLCLWLHQVNTY